MEKNFSNGKYCVFVQIFMLASLLLSVQGCCNRPGDVSASPEAAPASAAPSPETSEQPGGKIVRQAQDLVDKSREMMKDAEDVEDNIKDLSREIRKEKDNARQKFRNLKDQIRKDVKRALEEQPASGSTGTGARP